MKKAAFERLISETEDEKTANTEGRLFFIYNLPFYFTGFPCNLRRKVSKVKRLELFVAWRTIVTFVATEFAVKEFLAKIFNFYLFLALVKFDRSDLTYSKRVTTIKFHNNTE